MRTSAACCAAIGRAFSARPALAEETCCCSKGSCFGFDTAPVAAAAALRRALQRQLKRLRAPARPSVAVQTARRGVIIRDEAADSTQVAHLRTAAAQRSSSAGFQTDF